MRHVNSTRVSARRSTLYGEVPELLIRLVLLLAGFGMPSTLADIQGSVDAGFAANDLHVRALAVQPDGRMIVGGYNLNRLRQDGTTDTGFQVTVPNVSSNPPILAVAVQQDGGVLVGGRFQSIGGLFQSYLARFLADGTPDPQFSPRLNGLVQSIKIDAGGHILVGGQFSEVNGVARLLLARLRPDGSLDEGLAPAGFRASDTFQAFARRDDGTILLARSYWPPTGRMIHEISRLHPDGSRDDTFQCLLDEAVHALVVQEDDRIVIAGAFNTVSGEAQPRLARLHSDGRIDPTFAPEVASAVNSIALQADGTLIVETALNTPSGRRSGLHWLRADGTPRDIFHPRAKVLDSLALQADGHLLAGGLTESAFISSGPGVIRVWNEPAMDHLNTLQGGRALWRRAGSAPTAEAATLETTNDGGKTYGGLVAGSRTAEGWEFSGIGDLTGRQVRLRARVSSGWRNGSSGIAEWVTTLGTPKPSLSVDQPVGVPVGRDDERAFPDTRLQTSAYLIFTVMNTGTADLRFDAALIDGPGADFFSLYPVLPGLLTGPYGVGSFSVSFTPRSLGPQTAFLHLLSSDPAVGSLTVRLTGLGIEPHGVSDASLHSLQIGNGHLTPEFSATVTTYTAAVPYHNATLEVGAAPSNSLASVAVAGVRVSAQSYWRTTVSLVVGPNDIPIQVTATDGTRRSYTLTLTRAAQPGPGDVADLVPLPEYSSVQATATLPGGRSLLRGYFPLDLSQDPSVLLIRHQQGSVEHAVSHPHLGNSGPVAVQPDGRLLVGQVGRDAITGTYKWLDRVLPDGTLDASFVPPRHPSSPALCKTILLQDDGSILLTGSFPRPEGLPALNLVRLRADGSLDDQFVAAAFEPPTESIESAVLQPDGKIVVGGTFVRVDGIDRLRLARLQADGRLDPSFDPRVAAGVKVSAIAVQPDGKLIVGGNFSRLEPHGFPAAVRSSLARLESDGSVDRAFDPQLQSDYSSSVFVNSIALDSEGRIYLGGEFDRAGDWPRRNLARLLPDGTADETFDPRSDYPVTSMTLEANGSLLVVTPKIGGLVTQGVARLLAGPAIDTLTTDGIGEVEWIREGSAPEVASVLVEAAAAPGDPFLPLGVASRMSRGWRLSGVSLPPGGQVRARAQVLHASQPGSVGQLDCITAVGRAPAPMLRVTRDGAAVSHGDVQSIDGVSGIVAELRLDLRNVGEATISPFTFQIDGPDASEFSADGPLPPLPAGTSTVLGLRFAPTSPGTKHARLRLSAPDLETLEFPIVGTSAVSADAVLRSLIVRDWTIDPPYVPEIAEYIAEVAHSTRQVHVIASPAHPLAQVRIDGQLVADPDAGFDWMLSAERQTLAIEVTAQDGSTQRIFDLTVVRRAAPWPGDVDSSFTAHSDASPRGALPLADGGALIQEFMGDARVYRFRRVKANGTPAPEFKPAAFPGSGTGSMPMASLPDGGFLVAHLEEGNTEVAQGRFLVRLRPDGSRDDRFAHHLGHALPLPRVTCFAVEPDGGILIGGNFRGVSGIARPSIARLYPNGRLDPSFAPVLTTARPTSGELPYLACLAVQSDGSILVSGSFARVNGILRPRLARLERDGQTDTGFDAGLSERFRADPAVIQFDAANRILAGGWSFHLKRLLPNGQTDPTLTTSPLTDSFLPQVDGRIVLLGPVHGSGFDGSAPVLRVLADGQVDPSFVSASFFQGYGLTSLAAYPDGRLLAAGFFERVGGEPHERVARLLNGASSESLGVSATGHIRWERRGEAAEAHYVTFAYSINGGSTFTELGLASPVVGGWESSGALLPPSGHLRARARFVSGLSNAISSFAETLTAYSRPAGPRERWRQLHFDTWANAGPAADEADPDADGSNNLMEFACGTDPNRPGESPLSLADADDSGVSLAFTRSRDALAAGMTWTVEWNDSLSLSSPWTSDGIVLEVIEESADAQPIIARIPKGPKGHRYARLRVTAPTDP